MAVRQDSDEKLMVYRKILVVFSCVAVILPCLIGKTKLWLPLAAVLLALPAALLWKYPAARIVGRFFGILVSLSVPLTLLVLLCTGRFQEEYLFLCFIPHTVLPAAALAAMQDRRLDVAWMRIVAVLHMVECGLLIYYIFESGSWRDSILTGAVALVVWILSLLIHPISLKHAQKQ